MKIKLFLLIVTTFLVACGPSQTEFKALQIENADLRAKVDSLNVELRKYKYSPEKLLADAKKAAKEGKINDLSYIFAQIKQYHPLSSEFNEVKKLLDDAVAKDKNVQAKEHNIPQDVQQFIVLYKELLNFKNTSEFRNKGFGNGSKYTKWLTKANKLSQTADITHFSKYNFLPDDLVSLAYVYASSQGKENDASKALRTIIDDGINTIKNDY